MSITALELSTGPELATNDLGVHIIYVPDIGNRTPATFEELELVASMIGLEPKFTDIVVFEGQPWHYAFGHLRKHPEVHHEFPQTRLTLFRKVNHKAVWWSETRFDIVGIGRHEPVRAGAALRPFDPPKTGVERAKDGRDIYVARSAVPNPDADYQEYKISFTIQGETIDPNTYCDGGGG